MDIQKTKRPVKGKKGKLLTTPAHNGTEEKLQRFIEIYSKQGRILPACESAGIHHNTHYRHLQADANYRERFEESQQEAAQALEDTLYDMAMERDIQALLALLKRFRPQLYRERASLDITGDVTIRDALTESRARVIELERNGSTGTDG